MTESRPDLIGQTLGQYRLTKELGRGGFATVYRALQPSLNRYVAIKVLHPEFIKDDRTLRRFKREALAVARLTHPNIVGVYDYGEQDGRVYLVMEFISGDTLKAKLGKAVSPEFAASVIGAVGSALDYAHSKGLVHRDVKPGNILFTDDERTVLSDFGIVRLADDDSSLTRGVIGTPHYMSPEQALGKEVDGRSDLYSLGILLFELLTGRVPFRGESPIGTLSMHATLPVPSLKEFNPSLTDALDRVAQKALAKNPDERYQTGKVFSADLLAAITASTQPVEATVVMPSVLGADSTPTPTPVAALRDLESMYADLLQCTRNRDWRAAVSQAAQILARDPKFRDVSAILASASNELRFGQSDTSVELQMRNLIGESEAAVQAGRLMEAAAMLQQILRTNPDHAMARARLEEVNQRLSDQETDRKRQSRLGQLYSLVESKIESEDWRWASHIIDEIIAIDPHYRDIAELAPRVRKALGVDQPAPQSASHIVQLRSQAEVAMTEERWSDAVALFEEILQVEPGLGGISDRLTVAGHQANISALNAEVAKLAASGRWQEAISKLDELKGLTGT